jgi:hypothetical protein
MFLGLVEGVDEVVDVMKVGEVEDSDGGMLVTGEVCCWVDSTVDSVSVTV